MLNRDNFIPTSFTLSDIPGSISSVLQIYTQSIYYGENRGRWNL